MLGGGSYNVGRDHTMLGGGVIHTVLGGDHTMWGGGHTMLGGSYNVDHTILGGGITLFYI